MKRVILVVLMGLLVCSLALVGCSAATTSETMPKSIVISTYQHGTVGHVAGSAIATVVSIHTPMVAHAKPVTGATVQHPTVNRGENHTGICTFPDLEQAWSGVGEFTESHTNLRHLAYLLSHDLPFSIYSSTIVNEATAYEVTKEMFENAEELKPAHQDLSGFTGEAMVSRIPAAPFHPGAIRLYQEKGVWTKELEDHQKKYIP